MKQNQKQIKLPSGLVLNDFRGPFTPCSVAKYIVINAKEMPALGVTKLIKLVYIAHGWLLGLSDGERKLVDEPVEVWKYGPVFNSLYFTIRHTVQKNEMNEVPDKVALEEALAAADDINKEAAEAHVINYVIKLYGKYNAYELINKTHKHRSPWDVSRNSGEQIIANSLITKYYSKVIGASR